MKKLMLDEIPNAIIAELNQNYKKVKFELGSAITEHTKSFKSSHVYTEDELITMSKDDSDDYNACDGQRGYPTHIYGVRLDIDNDSVVVRAINHYVYLSKS